MSDITPLRRYTSECIASSYVCALNDITKGLQDVPLDARKKRIKYLRKAALQLLTVIHHTEEFAAGRLVL